MAAVDIPRFNNQLDHDRHPYRISYAHSHTSPSVMALEPRTSHYPLFIEPQFVQSPVQEEYAGYQNTQQANDTHEQQIPSESNPSRCIIDRIRTIKLDTPALRRAQMAFQHAPRTSSLARRAPNDETNPVIAYARDVRGGEPSAFALTSARIVSGSDEKPRSSSHTRNQSLQQRRLQGALTISSPTARQARGRPAGPMIWLPDEQVWLLADSEAATGTAAPPDFAYPNTAPLREATRGVSPTRGRRGSGQDQAQTSERNRLHRSDSSPIRTQFLRLMIKGDEDTSFAAQDWTHPGALTGPSAVEEDAVWYAEQQSRAQSRRDQDRFSPMLAEALVGVDLSLDPGPPGVGPASEYLAVPGDDDVWASHAMRRSSTTGDLDNIASILAAAEYKAGPGSRKTIAQRRSGSLRSRVSTVGNDDFDQQAASLHIRDLMEGPQRRHSADEAGTPETANDDYNHEWLSSLVSQGIVPEGIFTPRGSVSDGPGDGAKTPQPGRRGAIGQVRTNGLVSNVSPVDTGISRSATNVDSIRWPRGRFMSVSTTGGEEARGSVDMRDGGEVSPVSSRGRGSIYE